jgi:hypothetical protein
MDALVPNISRCPQQSVSAEDFTSELLWNNLDIQWKLNMVVATKQLEGKLGAKQLVKDIGGYWASTLRE